jgi:hypothetical protein
MSPKHHAYVPNELPTRLVGFRLSSVQLVMDYARLRFDGPTGEMTVLPCEALPAVATPRDEKLLPGERGHADALVALSGCAGVPVRTRSRTSPEHAGRVRLGRFELPTPALGERCSIP